MSSFVAEYTLLIVESPTLAKQLQEISPSHIYILATGGFLWKPDYNPESNKLGKKAIPEKLDVRKELRREASHAVNIVVATDSDPAGDFIAWTIHKELKNKVIKRSYLRTVSSSALNKLLENASDIDFTRLFERLQNRFRIRHLWSEAFPNVSMKDAALLAVFNAPTDITSFITSSGEKLLSKEPVTIKQNQQLKLQGHPSEPEWIESKPLSTYEVVELLRESSRHSSFSEAQELLRRTFETQHPDTDEGLITYPRTDSRSFFPQTWEKLQNQWIKERGLNEFLPESLRHLSDPDDAHEAIRPLYLDVTPEWIERHLPSDIGMVYRIVYSHTLKCLSLPKPATSVYMDNEKSVSFMSPSELGQSSVTVRPLLGVAELGHQLNKLGVLRPSGFGDFIDASIKHGKIRVLESGEVVPGEAFRNKSNQGSMYSSILQKLRTVADNRDLQDVTIKRILSS